MSTWFINVPLVRVPEVRGKADLTKYRDAGKEVIQVFLKFGAIVERASIDEAYIDLTNLVNERLDTKVQDEDLPNTFVVGNEENRQIWLQETFDGTSMKTEDVRLGTFINHVDTFSGF